ncbi:MAG: LiaI-LiaF-like domain-containing protein [Marinifilaceae bacterium]|jgi:predicted membrane protein
MEKRKQVDNRAVFGGLLVLLGLALVINNLNIMPWWLENIIFSWQMILVALGAIFYFGKQEKTTGIILMGVGGVFLIPEILDISYHYERFFWPAILILVGVLILRKRHDSSHFHTAQTANSVDYVDEMSIFGGGKRLVTSKNFKGGKITCVFGGSELDFRNAQLAEGTNVVDVFAMFGGCTLIVPSDWDVRVEITSILGGFNDKRINPTNYLVEPKKELIIRGTVLMGGGEIKSF